MSSTNAEGSHVGSSHPVHFTRYWILPFGFSRRSRILATWYSSSVGYDFLGFFAGAFFAAGAADFRFGAGFGGADWAHDLHRRLAAGLAASSFVKSLDFLYAQHAEHLRVPFSKRWLPAS